MLYCFHGTNKKNADKILVEGFNPKTYFARHLEDALEFGGNYVFLVEFDEKKFKNGAPNDWQFWIEERVMPDKIHRLTKYSTERINI